MPTPLPPAQIPPFNTCVLAAGTRLARVHAPGFDGAEPNPCLGGPTRFAPVYGADGSCVPTLYAAATIQSAIFESVFHDVPHTAAEKFVALEKVTSRVLSWLETNADLRLVSLFEPDLNRLNLTRADLIDTPPIDYAATARWAEAFHRADPGICGLVWTSRRCDPDSAYIFFGDRLPPDVLAVADRIEIARSADLLGQIRSFGRRAGITLSI